VRLASQAFLTSSTDPLTTEWAGRARRHMCDSECLFD
jgi:hypothetical protein